MTSGKLVAVLLDSCAYHQRVSTVSLECSGHNSIYRDTDG